MTLSIGQRRVRRAEASALEYEESSTAPGWFSSMNDPLDWVGTRVLRLWDSGTLGL